MAKDRSAQVYLWSRSQPQVCPVCHEEVNQGIGIVMAGVEREDLEVCHDCAAVTIADRVEDVRVMN